jgi:hypothetical protein
MTLLRVRLQDGKPVRPWRHPDRPAGLTRSRIRSSGWTRTCCSWPSPRRADCRNSPRPSLLEPFGEGGVATASALCPDCLGQGTCCRPGPRSVWPGPQPCRASCVAASPGAGGHGYDHAWVLAALGVVDADRIGVGQLIQLVEPIGHLLVLIQQDAELLVLDRERGDHPNRAVEHPGGALVVVVAELEDLVADPVDPPTEAALGKPLSRWGQRGLSRQAAELLPMKECGRMAAHRCVPRFGYDGSAASWPRQR